MTNSSNLSGIGGTTPSGCILPNGGISVFDGIILTIIQQFALWGNILVFVALFRYRVLRTIMNVFIASLSAADILVTVLPIPMTFAVFVCSWIPTQTDKTRAMEAYTIIDVMCGSVSIMSLMLVAVERCIAVSFPFRHTSIITKKATIICTCFSWMLALALAMLYISPVKPVTFTLMTIVISYGIPVPIMIASYTMIAYIARSQVRKIFAVERSTRLGSFADSVDNSQQSSDSRESGVDHVDKTAITNERLHSSAQPTQRKSLNIPISSHFRRGTIKLASRARSLKRELKAAKTLSLIMLSFLVTWTPFMAVNLQYYVCMSDSTQCNGNEFFLTPSVIRYSKFLHYFNSALNPFLYALLNRKWRAAFKDIVYCGKKTRNDSNTIQSELAGW